MDFRFLSNSGQTIIFFCLHNSDDTSTKLVFFIGLSVLVYFNLNIKVKYIVIIIVDLYNNGDYIKMMQNLVFKNFLMFHQKGTPIIGLSGFT